MRTIQSLLIKIDPEIDFSLKRVIPLPRRIDTDLIVYVDDDIKKLVNNEYNSISTKAFVDNKKLTLPVNGGNNLEKKSFVKSGEVGRKNPVVSLNNNILIKKWPLKLLGLTFFCLVTPLIIYFCSMLLSFFADFAYQKQRLIVSENFAKSSLVFASISGKTTPLFAKIPFIGIYYKKLGEDNLFLEKRSEIILRTTKTTKIGLSLWRNVVDGGDYDLVTVAKNLAFELENLYQDVSFLEGETKEPGKYLFLANKVDLLGLVIAEPKEKTYMLSKLAGNLSLLMGDNKPVTYLVLFQNSEVARPTGGRIDAFGFVTLSGGKIVKTQVFDTSFADKMLKGFVEPPKPYKTYFNQNTWFLKEAGWETDFKIAAAQAEWFIDKELGTPVGGVIAFDSQIISEVLDSVDRNNTFDDKRFRADIAKTNSNYPEEGNAIFKTHSEIFFDLLFNTKDRDISNDLKVLKLLAKGLDQKSVQIFLHDSESQRAVSEIKWGGDYEQAGCSKTNCFSDFVFVVETTKSGLSNEIIREAQLILSIEEGLVKRKLNYILKNVSDKTYEVYLRVVANSDSGFMPIEVETEKTKEKFSPETYGVRGLKESGVFLKILAHEEKAVIFSWDSELANNDGKLNAYSLAVIKQAGVKPFNFDVEIKVPQTAKIFADFTTTLTDNGVVYYNTMLSKDLTLDFSWYKK